MLFLWASILIALRSSSRFILWVSLEINILGFLPIIRFRANTMLENTMKYFLIQRISSTFFLFFSICNIIFSNTILEILILSSLIIKLGACPFHIWFISLINSVRLHTLFILSTLQKLIPIIILNVLSYRTNMVTIFIFMNSVLVFYRGVIRIKLNTVLAFSSINNLRWILLGTRVSIHIVLFYFLIYFILIAGVLVIFWNPFSSRPSQLSLSNYFYGLRGLIVMFSLAGLPPLLGFLSKLIIIKIILDYTRFFLLIIMVFRSLFILYFYMSYSYRRINMIPSNKLRLNNKLNSALKSMYLFILFRFNTLGIVLI